MNNSTNLTNEILNKTNNIIWDINDYNFLIIIVLFIYNIFMFCCGNNVYKKIIDRINENNNKFNIVNQLLASYVKTDWTLIKKNEIIKRRWIDKVLNESEIKNLNLNDENKVINLNIGD